jgi:[histone H3]-lysine4 N-trimethyltransferase ASH1L
MPLIQSTLRFAPGALLPDLATSSTIPPQPAKLFRSLTASSETLPEEPDGDTIVVGGPLQANPLPTPSDTTLDSLSECGRVLNLKTVPQGHGKRVTKISETVEHSQDYLLEGKNGNNTRSVSGETLVTSTSQSSLLQDGIAALDLPWNMSSVFRSSSQEQLVRQEDSMISTKSMQLPRRDEERATKAAAKKAKMEENAKLREAKIKAADEKATRRSKRASMMDRAGEIVSGLAASVLGKRSRDALELGKGRLNDLKRRASLRPRSMIEPVSAKTPGFEGPVAKRRRLSDSVLDKSTSQSDSFSIPRKPLPVRKEKKWLRSGLYIGQTRDFDGRLTESKNKRKSDAKEALPVRENKILPLPMFAGERLLKQGRDFKLPFDVFSPLPPGQPKPDEWKKTNKNVFIGDAAQFWRTTKLQEHSTCVCRPENGCDSNCMNRFMFYECDDSNCRLTEEQCGNRSFEALRQRVKKGGKYNVGVEVIKTLDRGYGVRSNRTFEPNQIIVEYTGEIITQEEADSRMNEIYKDNEVCLELYMVSLA